jgi:hypothetical protein
MTRRLTRRQQFRRKYGPVFGDKIYRELQRNAARAGHAKRKIAKLRRQALMASP